MKKIDKKKKEKITGPILDEYKKRLMRVVRSKKKGNNRK